MDGIDTTWKRFPGGEQIVPLVADAISKFNPNDPGISTALLQVHKLVRQLPYEQTYTTIELEKRAQPTPSSKTASDFHFKSPSTTRTWHPESN